MTDCKLVGEEFILNAVRHYRNVRIDHNADAESLRRMEEQLSSIKDLIFKNMLKWVGNQDSDRPLALCLEIGNLVWYIMIYCVRQSNTFVKNRWHIDDYF